jgi:hypothetical protein
MNIVFLFVLTIFIIECKNPSTDYTSCIRVFCGESYNYKQKWYQDCVGEAYKRCSYLL